MLPLCFVLMPFGTKSDASGRAINFDAVYRDIIAPAVKAAELDPIRADKETFSGTIHKPMFERLMLCPYAVADLTGANPNVYYELGIRHAMKPRSTVILFAAGTTLPFDVAPLHGIPYQTDEKGEPADPKSCAAAVTEHLLAARKTPHDDSPLFQLLDYMPRLEVDHTVTDTFRERHEYSKTFKERLAAARDKGRQAVREVIDDPALADLSHVEPGLVVDMLLTLRDVNDHSGMVALFERMPRELQQTRLVREQYAFALNRLGNWQKAAETLKGVIAKFGPSSETNGLLGRVFKDRWRQAAKLTDDNRENWVQAAQAAHRNAEARGLLREAVRTYSAGFQADWRDAYPGVNAVTLMALMDKPPPEQAEILPVVRYSATQKAKTSGDYWDFATLMELAIVGGDENAAQENLDAALAKTPLPYQLQTTEDNIALIRVMRAARGENVDWIEEIEQQLARKRSELEARQPSG